VDGMREAQYAKYLETRKLIKKPVHEIPGNHDKPEDFQKHIRPEVDMFFDHEWLRVVLMNNSHNDSHEGFFTAEQITWLGKTCDEAAQRGQKLLICAHVPVHHNTHPDRGWFVKPASGQTDFYAIVKKHESRVIALFHGHFHNGIRGWDDRAPVHEILFPSALYNQDRKLEAAKAPGYNLAEFRPGYTLVNIKDGAMTLQYKVTGTEEKSEKLLKIAAV
jgi:3',5'-cyclic AMP phosphodiesterase CpdA